MSRGLKMRGKKWRVEPMIYTQQDHERAYSEVLLRIQYLLFGIAGSLLMLVCSGWTGNTSTMILTFVCGLTVGGIRRRFLRQIASREVRYNLPETACYKIPRKGEEGG